MVLAAFFNSWLPTVDNLRNFLLTPTTEVLSFLPNLAGAVAWNTMHKSFKSRESSPQWTIFATRF